MKPSALPRATPTLGVGCRMVLVDGEPVRRAHFLRLSISGPTTSPKLGAFLKRLAASRIDPAEMKLKLPHG